MKSNKWKFCIVIFSGFAFALIGCSGGSGGAASGSASTSVVTGIVSAGPISSATVTAYLLNADGSQGSQLATATSDSTGKFSLAMAAQSAPLIIVASGGSYTEEASATTVSMGSAQIRSILPSVLASQQVGVTPVTEIAAQNTLAAISSKPIHKPCKYYRQLKC